MMPREEGVVRPTVTDRTPKLGPHAIFAATGADLQTLRRNLKLPDTKRLYLSGIYYDANNLKSPALVGPMMGAASAVMVLETLRVWGVRSIVFVGWCGSLSTQLRIGDILLPDSAIVDEGTSPHYDQKTGAIVYPHGNLCDQIKKLLQKRQVAHCVGCIWSTDGIFRETPTQIKKFQNRGALAVEMEFSALCSAAEFYALPFAALMIVSDELSTLQWRPGFKQKEFKHARIAVCDFLTEKYRSLDHDGYCAVGGTTREIQSKLSQRKPTDQR
jgi:purine-nucleoside phosphorylase